MSSYDLHFTMDLFHCKNFLIWSAHAVACCEVEGMLHNKSSEHLKFIGGLSWLYGKDARNVAT